jgi:hypothetical protein
MDKKIDKNVDQLVQGVKKIRRSFAREEEVDGIAHLRSSKDKQIKAVLKSFDGTEKALLSKIKALKGATNVDSLSKIGIKPTKIVKPTVSPSDCGEKAEGKTKAKENQTDEVEIEMITPNSIDCPETDSKGRQVTMVVARDGFVGCATIKGSHE